MQYPPPTAGSGVALFLLIQSLMVQISKTFHALINVIITDFYLRCGVFSIVPGFQYKPVTPRGKYHSFNYSLG